MTVWVEQGCANRAYRACITGMMDMVWVEVTVPADTVAEVIPEFMKLSEFRFWE